MAKAVIVTLVEEVAATLSNASGAMVLSFDAEPRYAPKLDFTDADHLTVQVFHSGTRAIQPDSRGLWLHEYDVDVLVHFRASAASGEENKAKFDDLQLLMEQIGDYYKTQTRRPSASDCYLVGTDIGAETSAPYRPDVIDTQNQFVSGVRLTFRKSRTNP